MVVYEQLQAAIDESKALVILAFKCGNIQVANLIDVHVHKLEKIKKKLGPFPGPSKP